MLHELYCKVFWAFVSRIRRFHECLHHIEATHLVCMRLKVQTSIQSICQSSLRRIDSLYVVLQDNNCELHNKSNAVTTTFAGTALGCQNPKLANIANILRIC